MDNSVYLTKEGLEKLQNEYEFLVNDRRPKVIETIQATRAMGDLSENGGYQAAIEEQSFIDKRIAELKEILKNAKVISAKNVNKISVGNTVTLKDIERKENLVYKIVGPTEANPIERMISYESPLGKALLNKQLDAEAVVETPGGKVRYKVIKIE